MFRSLLLPFLILPAAADEVVLSDGSRLSGSITELAGDGQIALNSPLAFEPFQILSDKIDRVKFQHPEKFVDDQDALFVLSNGDRFPGELEDINADIISVSTGFAGKLEIPRSFVSTVQLGVRPRKIIYSGPKNDAGWSLENGWSYDSNRFAATRVGTASRKFEIPGSFSLHFRVAWRNEPNMQVFFADEGLDTDTSANTDRYYLQFRASGIELKRQQSGGNQRTLPMASIPMDINEFTRSAAEIELRIDRELGFVHLVVDGKEEGKFADPLNSSPPGTGVMFRSSNGRDDIQYIDNILVREWDASANRHKEEKRGDIQKDVMITRSSDRGAGSILGMKHGSGGGSILFNAPQYPEPVAHPVDEVSTLFFAIPESDSEPLTASLEFTMGLVGRGALEISSCEISGDSLNVSHPLLGTMKVHLDAVSSLVRHMPETAEDREEVSE